MPRPRINIGPCSNDECDRPAYCRGLCKRCYGREWKRHQQTGPETRERVRARNRAWAAGRKPNPVTVRTKRCPDCREEKFVTEFNRQPKASDGLQGYCKPCASLRGRCRRVGITPATYHMLMVEQNGLCAICRDRRANALDHCHASNTFRGLICSRCNNTLATVRDSPTLLRALAEYVERTQHA